MFSYDGCNMVPLVGIGLTKTPISKWAKAHSAHLLTASLKRESSVPYSGAVGGKTDKT